MVPIIFGVLVAAACAFLTYVLLQFRREFLNVKKNFTEDVPLMQADIYRIEAAWKLASMPLGAGGKEPTKSGAVMQKEIVTSAIVGLVALVAPFVFVVLLHSKALSH